MISFICTTVENLNDREFMLWLYQEFKKLMFATARQYVPNPSDCEDIIQDCLVKLIEKIPVLREKKRCIVCSYVVYTVRNTSINYLRRQKVINSKMCSLEEQASEIAAAELSMDELMIVMEHKERLYEIWGQLPEEDLILLEGKYILRCSDSELAEQLHCKPDSIRMKLTRVRRKVFRMMNSNGGDSE